MLRQPCVAVAYSGGRDSAALLHAVACAAQAARTAEGQGDALHVVALHVHHGLSPQADAWLDHARATCEAWAAQGLPVRLLWRRVQVPQGPGLSVEAEARTCRHAALHEMAVQAGADLLLLAHHRRDQAETLLLQALRGAGVAGLSAMPRQDWRAGVLWVRPWLDHPREAIEAYIAQHGLRHIDDDSNGDPRFARNRLRLQVWPALQAAFPQAEATLAASADRLADALVPLRRWQEAALAELGWPEDGTSMDAEHWASWSPAERRESLRQWFARVSGRTLPARWTLRLAEEVPRMLADARDGDGSVGVGVWPALGLSLYRGRLRWERPDAGAGLAAADGPAPAPPSSLCIDAPGDWPLPAWGGILRVQPCAQGGVAPARLLAVTACARTGGERFQMGPGRPPRALKKQFQAAGVPAWERDAPLLWAGDQLVFVPGLGLDARVWASVGDEQWALSWHRLDARAAAALKCEV